VFNLEESIAEWRAQMVSAGVRKAEILAELESHLRDDWERRALSGESERKAFENAVNAVGQPALLRGEFAKIAGKKWAWLRKLKGMMSGDWVAVPSLDGFTPGARQTLALAALEAPRLNHGFIGTEHVLLGLLSLEEGVVPSAFKKLGVNRGTLKREIEKCVSVFPAGEIPAAVPYTPRVNKALRFAAREAKVAKNASVGPEHILLGLILEGDGVAGQVLRDAGITPETARNEIRSEAARNESGD
jgi:hypothetical protein